jgi:hypothetical protein
MIIPLVVKLSNSLADVINQAMPLQGLGIFIIISSIRNHFQMFACFDGRHGSIARPILICGIIRQKEPCEGKQVRKDEEIF